jgi:ribosomal protein L4
MKEENEGGRRKEERESWQRKGVGVARIGSALR